MIKVSTPTVLMEMADHGEKASSKIKGKPMKMDEKLIKKLGIQLP